MVYRLKNSKSSIPVTLQHRSQASISTMKPKRYLILMNVFGLQQLHEIPEIHSFPKDQPWQTVARAMKGAMMMAPPYQQHRKRCPGGCRERRVLSCRHCQKSECLSDRIPAEYFCSLAKLVALHRVHTNHSPRIATMLTLSADSLSSQQPISALVMRSVRSIYPASFSWSSVRTSRS